MLLLCVRCEAKVNAEEVATADFWDAPPDEGGVKARVVLLKCPSCTSPMLVRQDEVGWDEDEEGVTTSRFAGSERLYPAERKVHARIPSRIHASLTEALRCLEYRCYVASAIMCRRTLEALCRHHGVKENNLAASLKALHQAKVIDDRLYEWADALRRDGNLAAHEPDAQFTRQDAEDLAEFSEAILEYVFVLTDRFAAFKQRRAATGREPTQ